MLRMIAVTLASFLCVVFAGSAFAQARPTPQDSSESPYAPLQVSPASLITLAEYREIPVVFTYRVVSQQQETRNKRLDFVLVFDTPFEEFVADLEKAMDTHTPFARVAPNTMKYMANEDLMVVGKSIGPGRARFTLSNQQTPFRFNFEVEAEDGKTRVYLWNKVFADLYSGVSPDRAPYRPIGTEEVPLRRR